MDQYGQKIIENNFESKRSRKNIEKTSFNIRNSKTKKIFQKIEKEGLDTRDLLHLLKGVQNFLGVYASDQIPLILDSSIPIFLIVNLDNSKLPGSHWIALRITFSTVEIFDSLGFNPQRWQNFPASILKFFSRYSYSHRFYASQRIQNDNSYTCGLYCVYFILVRQKESFQNILRLFSNNYSENDKLVLVEIKNLFYLFIFSLIKIHGE